MKKILFAILVCILLLSSFSYAKEFPDVASTHWAYNYINELSEQGVINGYEDGTYRPNGTVTRAEFLKLMVCTDDYRTTMVFLPQSLGIEYQNWYDVYVEQASDILSFDFGGNYSKPITRIEMARVIKDFSLKDLHYDREKVNEKNNFKDTDKLSESDNEIVSIVKGLGIISGYEDNSFRPSNNMTRAEVSAVISRYMNKKGVNK